MHFAGSSDRRPHSGLDPAATAVDQRTAPADPNALHWPGASATPVTPVIEPAPHTYTGPNDERLGYAAFANRQRRRRLFVLIASLVVIGGLLYSLLVPSLFRSAATVLVAAPRAIDADAAIADLQGVAIQRRTLLGSEVLQQLSDRLAEAGPDAPSAPQLATILDVTPVPDTNLLEVSATSPDAAQLPQIVTDWIDVYSGIRAADIERRKGDTQRQVQEEITALTAQVEDARAALDDFRRDNDIVSIERSQNAVFARLDGLNSALNNAVEEEVAAQARLTALRESVSAGSRVVPEGQRAEVDAMSQELNALQAQLTELRARYTDAYIRKDPTLREIPERIVQLEASLRQAYRMGGSAALDEAEQRLSAARTAVRDLEQRLDAHKEAVADFNTTYAKHEALSDDLKRLEELSRDAQARLASIDARPVERYPQVTVIDPPAAASVRVSPDYALIAGITAIGALLAGVISVWLHDYLNPEAPERAYVTLSGVHFYPQDARELPFATSEERQLPTGAGSRIGRDRPGGEQPDGDS